MNNHLDPRPNDCCEKPIVERGTEDIPMNQLPSFNGSMVFWQDGEKSGNCFHPMMVQ